MYIYTCTYTCYRVFIFLLLIVRIHVQYSVSCDWTHPCTLYDYTMIRKQPLNKCIRVYKNVQHNTCLFGTKPVIVYHVIYLN